jgi:hypothetical protein
MHHIIYYSTIRSCPTRKSCSVGHTTTRFRRNYRVRALLPGTRTVRDRYRGSPRCRILQDIWVEFSGSSMGIGQFWPLDDVGGLRRITGTNTQERKKLVGWKVTLITHTES